MGKIVQTGITTYGIGDRSTATGYAPVSEIIFPDIAQTINPGVGTSGTLTITRVPVGKNYLVNDEIYYQDGNNNNTKRFRITSVIGPFKYAIVII